MVPPKSPTIGCGRGRVGSYWGNYSTDRDSQPLTRRDTCFLSGGDTGSGSCVLTWRDSCICTRSDSGILIRTDTHSDSCLLTSRDSRFLTGCDFRRGYGCDSCSFIGRDSRLLTRPSFLALDHWTARPLDHSLHRLTPAETGPILQFIDVGFSLALTDT